MADDLHLNVVTDSDARGLKEAEKELAATGKEAKKLDDIFISAVKASDDLDTSLHEQTDEVKKLQAEYARTKKSVSDLTVEWLDADRENDQIVKRELRRERSRLSELQRAASEFEGRFGIKFNADLTSFTAVEAHVTKTVGGLREMRAEYEKTQRRIKELRAGILRGNGDDSSIINLRAARAALEDLTRMGTQLGVKLGTEVGDGLLEGLSAAKMPALVGAIGGLLTAALPPLGAMIGGGIAGAVGTGAMAAGILSASHDSEVKAAAKDFGNTISGEFFSSRAFVGPVISGLGILKQGFRDLDIGGLLAPLAPTVITIAHGIADFVNNLKDAGLDKSFGRMEKFAHIAAEGLAEAGDALGFFFDEVTKDEGAADGLRAFFAVIIGTTRFAAFGISLLEKAFHVFSVTMAGVITLAERISPIDLGPFVRGAMGIVGALPQVSGQLVHMTGAARETNSALDPFVRGLMEAEEHAKGLTFDLKALFGVQMNMDEATLHWKEGLVELNKELKLGKFNLDDKTESGLRHQQMVLSQIQKAQELANATYAETGSRDAANRAYLDATEALRKFLIKAGLSKEAIDKLIGDYKITITTTFRTVGMVAGVHAKYLVEGATADLLGAPKRAKGGPVNAGEPYVVGDGGQPELFVPRQNGMIIPSVRGMGGGGMGARPLVIQLPPGASDEEQRLVERIRTAVAARGGTLAVLGLRA